MRKQLVCVIGSISVACLALLSISFATPQTHAALEDEKQLDQALMEVLRQAGFTGRIESSLERRLGRRVDPKLAEIGRLLWFDTITGLNDDNT